nr:NADH dehydrogenase subunit 6 [Nothopoda sp.]
MMLMEMIMNISIENQIMTIMLIIYLSMFYSNFNPMKMAWKMMMIMTLMTFMIYIYSMKSFLPLITNMIMIGGILMIYIMMMSMLPNQKMKSWSVTKMKFIFFYFILFYMSMSFKPLAKILNVMEIKLIMYNNYQFYFLMMMMIIYFIMNLILLESEKTSLRSMN